MQSGQEPITEKDLLIIRMREDNRIWNEIIFKELVDAVRDNDKFLINYWLSMFI